VLFYLAFVKIFSLFRICDLKQRNAPFPGFPGYLEFLSLVEADMFRLVFNIAYKNIGSNFNVGLAM